MRLATGRFLVQGEAKEQWQKLCEQAAVEQNSERLMVLIREICQMLEDKEKRLQQKRKLERKRAPPNFMCFLAVTARFWSAD